MEPLRKWWRYLEGIRRVVGAIQPQKRSKVLQVLANRTLTEKIFFLQLQGTCDTDLLIADAFCGCPGFVREAPSLRQQLAWYSMPLKRNMTLNMTVYVSLKVIRLRPRPHVSGYISIRKPIFTDLPFVHTYSVNSAAETAKI